MLMKFPSLLLATLMFCPTLFAANVEKLSEDDWLSIKSKNFEIITDLNQEKGIHLIESLEAYRYFSIEMLNLDVVDDIKPLKIIAVNNSLNFKRLGLPEMIDGVFHTNSLGYSAMANVSGYSADIKTANAGRHTLFHEYNHFLIRFAGDIQKYPLWYNEGMAEYWATFKFDNDKVFVGDLLRDRTISMFDDDGDLVLNSEKLFNTKNLPLESKKQADKESIWDFYAQSFYLIHYFNSSPQLLASLKKYVQLLNYGYKEEQAFQKAFNLTYAELDTNAKKYLKSGMVRHVFSLKQMKMSFPKPEIQINHLEKTAFYLAIGDVLPDYRMLDNETRIQILETTIALNPDSADARARLLYYGWAKEPAKMEQEIEKLDAKNSLFLTYKADKLAASANILRAAGIASWQEKIKQARNNYRKAINSDRSFMLPYIGLGNAYKFIPSNELLQEAILGLNTATLLVPVARNFAQLADIYIRMDKSLEALPAVRSLVAYGQGKSSSEYSLIHDNLEMLNDLTHINKALTAEGIEFDSGTVYSGAVDGNKPSGKGKIVRANGSFFEGTFVNGIMQGQGKLVTYNGFVYEGEFQNGIARGKGKILYPNNSATYEGDIYYSFPFGKGVRTEGKGKYEGDFWYSYQQGDGTFTSADGKNVLHGKWIENRYTWPEINGRSFVGYISESGKRDGEGVCLEPAGAKIEWCSYKDGELQLKNSENIAAK